MKLKSIHLIIIIIILVHFFVFLYIMLPHHKSETKQIEPAEPVQTAETAEREVTSSVLEPLGNSAAAVQASSLELPPFSDTFFTVEQRQLPAAVQKLTTSCASGLAADLSSRKIFWAKDPFSSRPMASISKMMTAYLAVKKMKESNGTITLDTPIKVTKNAAGIGGREVWIDTRETFTFNEILKAMLVHSANDCAYLMAEFMGGSEQAFVAEMNREAVAMGCRRFKFFNSHGLTLNNQDNTAAPVELAYLAARLLDIPEIVKWTSVKTEYLRENDQAFIKRNKGQATMLSNSNKLLGRCKGVNGMKTGFTNKAGFCIVATCERDNRRVCVVVMGSNKADRDNLAGQLIDWVYSQQ